MPIDTCSPPARTRRHRRTTLSRAMALLALILASTALAAVPGSAQADATQSTVGGVISRSEILARAQYWVDRKVPYSMSGYTGDPQGRSYRTDCSGFVSMALHLPTSASTVSLPNYLRPITWAELQPGDVVGTLGDGTAGSDGHVVIFNGWADSAHTTMRTLEETPPYAVARTRPKAFTVGSHVAKPYRYTKVVSDATAGHDFDGDGDADVLHRRSDGSLYYYRGDGEGGFHGSDRVMTGWGTVTAIAAPGDFDGDGRPDLLVRRQDGDLYFYRGDGTGHFSMVHTVITGWSTVDLITGAGDFDGDGDNDVFVRRNDGSLYLYKGDGHGRFTGSTELLTGWSTVTGLIGGGDFDGDGHPDAMVRRSDGNLYFYPGNGSGGFRTTRDLVITGWATVDPMITPGDFDGDGRDDVLARRKDGNLYLYRGDGEGGFSGSEQVISGWGTITAIV